MHFQTPYSSSKVRAAQSVGRVFITDYIMKNPFSRYPSNSDVLSYEAKQRVLWKRHDDSYHDMLSTEICYLAQNAMQQFENSETEGLNES